MYGKWSLNLLAFLALALTLFTCDWKSDQGADRLLARVFNRELHLSDLENMFPEKASRADSFLIIQAFVSRWVREELLMYEAEKNLPPDLNIDQLVRDYRRSLIRNNYEQVLVEQLLDSTVTKTELQGFYEQNKEQYELETPIIRCYFIKIAAPIPKADSLLELWAKPRGNNLSRLEAYCQKYATAHTLVDSIWHKVDVIGSVMPKGTITADNIASKREFRQSDGKFVYYFRLLELKNRKEIAPLGYIEQQARTFVLHKRKLDLLQRKREDLYEIALKKGNVEIF
ncbi:MAG: hypothetical protein SFV55_25755 [Haliscomenobacter sp.]|uniref:hypothetical protein n=1 Tax=Haliscomenobacter sp. TaxID=2717303 RepID=UPI0029BD2ADE|nr:hypothetical protein [Haliscomenobacter sp.]MDX2071865.1 hypothetical protein [Haliscomenobacter sp.]